MPIQEPSFGSIKLQTNEKFTLCYRWITFGNLGYFILAILLVIAWIIGFYSTSIGDIIHILPVMAIIVVIIRIFNDEKLLKKLRIKLK